MLHNNQEEAIKKSLENNFESGVHFQATGCGKCQKKGTPIIMYDGSIKKVEDIKINDLLMGDDSKPRRVLSLIKGIGKMYNVYQNNGDTYTVNSEHILCLLNNNQKIEISVNEYMRLSLEKKLKLKGYKTQIDFNEKKINNPFIVGFLSGYYNLKINKNYIYNSRKNRLKLLYGIYKSIGKIIKNYIYFENNKILGKDIIYISKSLGFKCIYNDDYILIDIINKDLSTNIEIKYDDIYDYYGFTLDGNHKYILGDFTVTHNSWIALKLVLKFNELYPKENILWLCEYKTILKQQFIRERVKNIGFTDIYKKFNILEYHNIKQKDWTNSINCAKYWNKPALIIINRAFLTSCENYKKISLSLGLIIHDESHTIINNSTQKFYNYFLEKYKNLKCIGFSATPCLDYSPFKKIISSYSIYKAFIDNIIVPPKIVWFNSDYNSNEIAKTVRELISELPYKKIIVWCGMIELCNKLAIKWKKIFKNYQIFIDTSINDNNDFNEFQNIENNAILFCASKHREGSDIKNLDGCVFMDGVTNRNSKTFVQCIGRVLRKDSLNNKKFGLIIDVEAKSPIKVFKRLHEYLLIGDEECKFPWKYEYKFFIFPNQNKLKIHYLTMQKNNTFTNLDNTLNEKYTIKDLIKNFVRKIPDLQIYKERLNEELILLESKNLIKYLLQAVKILEITKGIPHITRGSCGSSLICYMLGISHVDPVLYNIKFARFLNEFRDNLPDIDFDFPYNLRDEVFLKLELLWPGKVARISNHNFFHTKSALRQAIRNVGIRHFIPKNLIHKEINKLDYEKQQLIKLECSKLEETFKGYSLHCGGIVFYPEGVPDNLIIKGKKYNVLNQIVSNKEEISKEKKFKIDILSSRGLAQLFEGVNYHSIDFENIINDNNVFKLLSNGDNIGLTFAESPLIRKAFMKIKPKSVYDIAICLAIIRPAAKDARNSEIINKDSFIFDDDAIDIIAKTLNCSDGVADKLRRLFAKSFKKGLEELKKYTNDEKDVKKLKNLTKYSFCKSHAYSYAQLIYKLAELKYYNPKNFWLATLKHCHSSYKKWVHYYEARLYDIRIKTKSIYAQNRKNSLDNYSIHEQLLRFGYWNMETKDFFPDCFFSINNNQCNFRGIIASVRTICSKDSKKIVIFLGVETRKYINIEWNDERELSLSKYIGVQGTGTIIDYDLLQIQVDDYFLF